MGSSIEVPGQAFMAIYLNSLILIQWRSALKTVYPNNVKVRKTDRCRDLRSVRGDIKKDEGAGSKAERSGQLPCYRPSAEGTSAAWVFKPSDSDNAFSTRSRRPRAIE
jgi:hypothetical protein